MSERLRVSTSDGKYTVIQPEFGLSTALWFGKPWPAYEGKPLSNLELALAYDLHDTRSQLAEVQNEMREHRSALATKDAEIARLEAENERMRHDAQFLISRLSEFSLEGAADELFDDWNCHVAPAIARLRAALSPIPDPAGGTPVEVK